MNNSMLNVQEGQGSGQKEDRPLPNADRDTTRPTQARGGKTRTPDCKNADGAGLTTSPTSPTGSQSLVIDYPILRHDAVRHGYSDFTRDVLGSMGDRERDYSRQIAGLQGEKAKLMTELSKTTIADEFAKMQAQEAPSEKAQLEQQRRRLEEERKRVESLRSDVKRLKTMRKNLEGARGADAGDTLL